MTFIVLNVGSSSLKFAVFEQSGGAMREIARGQAARASALDRPGAPSAADRALVAGSLDDVERAHGRVDAVGHRVVHGGRAFFAPVLIDDATLAAIEALAPLAPLHQPHNTMAIRAVATLRPGMAQVACFDTAFHRTQPEIHRRLPLPERFFEAGIERYGFHGLSYSWLAQQLARLRGALPKRVLAFHLGAGASACAMRDGLSVNTSMGFSTLDGLMMGTRPGTLDPGVLLHLLEQHVDHDQLVDLLYMRSGLRGVSGLTADMKTLLSSPDPASRRAVDMFCHHAAAMGAGLTAALGGLDAIAFTGGIGEHSPEIRARIGATLGFLGAAIDPGRNDSREALISPDGAKVECWVVAANEERVVAEALAALTNRPST